MKEHAALHRLYTSLGVVMVRLLLVVGLLTLFVLQLVAGKLPLLVLFTLSSFIMWEVYFHFSFSRMTPRKKLSEVQESTLLQAASHQVVDLIATQSSTSSLVQSLIRTKQVSFLMSRLQLSKEQLPQQEVAKEALLSTAYRLATVINADYLTVSDLFAAYLLLCEPEAKLLFSLHMHETDLETMLLWVRCCIDFQEEVVPFGTPGAGIWDGLVYGWTPETKRYTTLFSLGSQTDIGYRGRENVIVQITSALQKPTANTVVIVGEPGVGKEAIVSYLARESYAGRLTDTLNHKRFLTLMLGPLVAGISNRAELEARLQAIIAELTHAGNIVLVIPEFQDLLGSPSYTIDVSSALLPYLKEGTLPIIATMTTAAYKHYLAKGSLRDAVSVVAIEPPPVKILTTMLFHKLPELEAVYKVTFSYLSLMKALELAATYLPDAVSPGNVVTLLENAAERAKQAAPKHTAVVTPEMVTNIVEEKVHVPLAEPTKAEKQSLLHLEDELHKRVIGQNHAIRAIADAMRRVRSGVTSPEHPVSFLFLGTTGVGKTETAKALAEIAFGSRDAMTRLDMSEFGSEASLTRLLGAPPGTGDEPGELTDKVHDTPYTLILLDEFEKAHPKVLDLFLQVLSDGRLTDNKGRTVSFTHTILIATSNACASYIKEATEKGITLDAVFQKQLLTELQTQHLFKPELLNRFSGVILFTPLARAELEQVTQLLLQKVRERLVKQDISLSVSPDIIQAIIEHGSDEAFGARPLERYIQDTIEDAIAKLMLEDKLKRGDTVTFLLDASGAIQAQPATL